jgi:hypothetical protein
VADFEEGYRYENDNLNLAFMSFLTPCILSWFKGRDQSSVVFSDEYTKLQKYLVEPNVCRNLSNLIILVYYTIK